METTSLEKSLDDFMNRYEEIGASLRAGKSYDYNSLTLTARQAALALISESVAVLKEIEGRLTVTPSVFLRHPFLNVLIGVPTAGLIGIKKV